VDNSRVASGYVARAAVGDNGAVPHRPPSPTGARLLDVATPKGAVGAVLVLHGGAQRRMPAATRRTQLSVIRMVPIARAIARAGRRQVAVHRLLNSFRGWNAEHQPTDDVAWALSELRDLHGDVPVVLVGHSLGGRAALLAGQDAAVAGVVALNPWVYPTDDARLEGREVLVVHGDADRIAPLSRAQVVVDRLARRTRAELVVVPGGKHAMLSQSRVFTRHTTDFVTRVLLGRDGGGPR
jgi:pimeloyl-ACP methyl ester carboxylesterase